MNTLNEDLVKWGSKRKHLMVSWDHTSYMQKGSIMSVGLKYTTHHYPNLPGETLPQVSLKYS